MKALIINCSPVRDGATAYIAQTVAEYICDRYELRTLCIDDFDIALCRGCRTCHTTARCVMNDGAQKLMEHYEWADTIIHVSPSYWADVPGQFKVFIDRCTPWCNTHQPHASLSKGKKGFVIALRTGPGVRECQRIVETLEHFCSHLEIERAGSLCLCGVENKEDAAKRAQEICTALELNV